MDPAIAEIYRQSKAVSTSQGASYQLLKATSKRRRTKQQIIEQEEEERRQKLEIQQKLDQFE